MNGCCAPDIQLVRKCCVLLLLVFFFSSVNITAQVSNVISSVTPETVKEGNQINVTAELIQPSVISRVNLFYMPFGGVEYEQTEMEIIGDKANAVIPQNEVLPPYISYYILVELTDNTTETYPLQFEEQGIPIQIEVLTKSEKDEEVIILTPAEGEVLPLADVFISVSLIKAGDKINPRATKVYLNDYDVSQYALFAGDLVLLYPENFEDLITTESYNIKVEAYDTTGALYHTVTSNFQAVDKDYAIALKNRFVSSWELNAESRNENYNDESTWYNNISARFNGAYDEWDFKGYAYITSEEKGYLQPQNRFSVSVENDWLRLRGGDTYPRYTDLVLNGKRMRGISGEINLGFFNLQTSYGETLRDIEGSLVETFARDEAPLETDVVEIDSAKYGNPYGRVNFGTFGRDMFVIRPSFNAGESFEWGFSYLHSKDKVNSIEFGGKPQENVLAGTDLFYSADDRNIIVKGEAAVSLFNSDITGGTLTDAEIDSVFGDDSFYDADPEDVKDLRDWVSNFITVNQFVGPLNPQELASVAGEASLQLNYFQNNFTAKYIYRGNDYRSFGKNYIRNDVKGINLVDRIRLVQNKLFISLGYERLTDNLQETKVATTTYNTFNALVSIFPRTDFPNITLGYTHYNNGNDLSPSDTLNGFYAIDDATNKYRATMSYDFTAGVKHNSSLSITTSNREDESRRNSDAETFSTNFTLNSYWNDRLTSYFNIVYYTSTIQQVDYDYVTISLGGRLKAIEDKLELTAYISPSFGDFKRQSLDVVAQYFVVENFSLIFQTRLYRIPDQSTNSIVGLTTRLTL